MLQMIYGRAGSGKTTFIRNRLCELAKEQTGAIILLVPEQYSFESERAMLKLLGASDASSVEVLSFSRLADLFFQETGGRALPVLDDIGRFSVMEPVVKALKPELMLYKRQAESPEFINALLDLSDELKRAAAEPHDLMRLAENAAGLTARKARETALILSSYDDAVKSRFLDPRDDLTRMAQAVGKYNFFDNKIVAVDSFKGFTAAQKKVLEAIVATAKQAIFTFCCEGTGKPDEISVFSNVETTASELIFMAKKHGVKILPAVHLEQSFRFQNEALAELERNIFRQDACAFGESSDQVEICEAKNAYDECDFAAGKIRSLVMDGGYRYRDIAVIARDIDAYADKIIFSFKKYDIPVFIDKRNSARHMPIFGLVIYALKTVLGGFSSDDIFDCLKTGLCVLSEEEIREAENYVLTWKITGVRWFEEWRMNPEGVVETFSEKERERLYKINETRGKITDLFSKLKNGMSGTSAKGFSAAVYRFVLSLGADHRLAQKIETARRQGDNDLADTLRRSYGLFIRILDQLALALGDSELTASRYLELFTGAVASADLGGPPQGLDQVMAGSAERMRPAAPKAIFILGANEGVFPKNPSSGGLFTDAERAELIAAGIEIADNGVYAAADETFLCYSAVTAASDYLCVSYRISDSAGISQKPSGLIEEIESVLPNCKRKKARPFISAKVPAIEAMARQKNTPLSKTIEAYFGDRSICYIKDTKTDINLPAETAGQLFGANLHVSPSKIDVFYKCRFSYFCQYGLKAKPFRPAEIGALERGSLIHFVLEKLVTHFGGKGLAKAGKEEIDAFVRASLREYIHLVFEGAPLDDRMGYLIERIRILLCDLAAHLAADFAQSDFEPAAEELVIDDSGTGILPVCIPLSDGGSITVRGKIDRVDSFKKDGKTYVRVIDYKTGGKSMELGDVLYGQNLQMLVYLSALTRNGASFFGTEVVPAGVLYMPSLSKSSTVDRKIEESKRAEQRLKSRRMNGLVLDDSDVIHAMEPEGLGLFVPVKLKKDGEPDSQSSVAGLGAIGNIAKHIDSLLIRMGRLLHEGDLAAEPVDGIETAACKYCEYRGVCGRSEDEENGQIEKRSFKEAIKEFEGGDEHGL